MGGRYGRYGVTLRIKYTTLVSSSCAVCRTQRYQDYKYTYFIVYTPLHIMFTYLCSLYHLHVSLSLCNALCACLQLASFIDWSALHCMVGSICCNRDLNISTVKLSICPGKGRGWAEIQEWEWKLGVWVVNVLNCIHNSMKIMVFICKLLPGVLYQ